MSIDRSDILLKHLIAIRDFAQKTDKGKIGSFGVPEILSCSNEGYSATFGFPFPNWMQNYNGVMHGGMIAFLLDSSMGWFSSAFTDTEETTPTISMNISYFNPVIPTDKVIIKVKIRAVKSKIIYASAELYSDKDSMLLLAAATGEYYKKTHKTQRRKS